VQQLDLFSTPSSPSSPLIDQHIRLDRVCSCGSNIAIIGSSSPTVHAARLSCANCGTFAGWLPQATAQWLTSIVTRFGAPPSSSPIDVRRQAAKLAECPDNRRGLARHRNAQRGRGRTLRLAPVAARFGAAAQQHARRGRVSNLRARMETGRLQGLRDQTLRRPNAEAHQF
jgi:hypothetical protein